METQSSGDGRAPGEVQSDGGELAPGERVASYRVVRLIGRGGMGEVYEAEDTRLKRPVALKRIAARRRDDGSARARFWREARGLAAVKHPGLVAIYEIGEDPKTGLFIAMELVEGAPLSSLVEREGERQMRPEEATGLVSQAAEALGAAHAAGLVHRDIKPSNILVDAAGRVRVVDFGLARRVDDVEQLTRDGAVLGTPAFMAPEQLEGRAEVGPQADVFALGLVLYRLLTGVHPFARESSQATALAIAGSIRRPLAELCPGLDAGLVAVVDRALDADPARRFPDARAMGKALAPFVSGVVRGVPSGSAEPEALASQPDLEARIGGPARRLVEPGRVRRRVPGRRGMVYGLGLVGAIALAVIVIQNTGGGNSSQAVENEAKGSGSRSSVAGGQETHETTDMIGSSSVAPGVPGTSPDAATVGDDGDDAEGGGAALAPSKNTLSLPTRPVLLVVGFTAEPTLMGDADVLAEVLRVRLAERDGLVESVPIEVARALRPGATEVDAEDPPTSFARATRGPGNVDAVVRGYYRREGGGVEVGIEVCDTVRGEVLWRDTVRSAAMAAAPVEVATLVSVRLEAALGLPPLAERADLSSQPAAWTALLAARRAGRAADLEGARAQIQWALSADPDFALARVEELSVLRMEGRTSDLVARGRALLETPHLASGLTAAARGLAEALVSWARGESVEALRAFDALGERFPYELDAALQLMALRAKDRLARDPAEVERIARRVLMVAPRQETAISRLTRALGIQGRASEAEAFLVARGLSRQDRTIGHLWAEVDLFAGRFEEALGGFRGLLEHEPGNVYYEHMAIAAELLTGRCEASAAAALARIERFAKMGRESMNDWTYSLAAQSLLCDAAWGPLERLLAAWRAAGTSGSSQVADLEARIALVRAELDGDRRALDALATRWRREVAARGDRELLTATRLLRVERDPAALRALAERGKELVLDVQTAPTDRSAWRWLAQGAAARLALVEGTVGPQQVVALHRQAVPRASELAGEDEAHWLVEALVRLAEAQEELGDAGAADTWRQVAALGYARLWTQEASLLARHRLAALATP